MLWILHELNVQNVSSIFIKLVKKYKLVIPPTLVHPVLNLETKAPGSIPDRLDQKESQGKCRSDHVNFIFTIKFEKDIVYTLYIDDKYPNAVTVKLLSI